MNLGIDFSKIRMVTYKGSGETLIAVAGGHLSASMTTIGGTQPFLASRTTAKKNGDVER